MQEKSDDGGRQLVITYSHVFQGENILLVELDMPNRTTRDYEGPAVAPKIQAALDIALQDEEDIDIDGRYAITFLI